MLRLLASLYTALCISVLAVPPLQTAEVTLRIDSPMLPPYWAVLERELLRAHLPACKEYIERSFDANFYLQCVVRWGGADGADDAIEAVNDWPILHILGAPQEIYELYGKAWEGHLRQYTEAKTVDVPFARDGMYYKEFHTMLDWVHVGEGLTVFNIMGLSDPNSPKFQKRVRRFAGFYTGEDPSAANYDPKHKVIRSMFNGSRGPLLRPATSVDWAGDYIDDYGRFGRSDRNYKELLAHFKDYSDVVGDHPLNLLSTSLALNAYMLAHEKKYKDWLVEYADAWVERTRANGNLIPTKIGLDGTIGGPEGKWYGGVYGWGFSPAIPRSGILAHRNMHYNAIIGFGNALLVTGDQGYVDVWRDLIDTVNANGKVIDGRMMYPTMYGDEGWYAYEEMPYRHGAFQVYFWSMDRRDLERVPQDEWVDFLEGKDPEFPERALQGEFEILRDQVERGRADSSIPDMRSADWVDDFNPATVKVLLKLMLGGIRPIFGGPLHCRLRYFDLEERRPGVPQDVAALIEKLADTQTTVTLVNISPTAARTVVVQGGAYGEHHCTSVVVSGKTFEVNQPYFTVRLAPGAGARLVINMRRYANQPTLLRPWDRVLLPRANER